MVSSFRSSPVFCEFRSVALTHCGGFIFRPWIKEGDIGTVVYLDHDMDATVTGGKEAKPLTERNHAGGLHVNRSGSEFGGGVFVLHNHLVLGDGNVARVGDAVSIGGAVQDGSGNVVIGG